MWIHAGKGFDRDMQCNGYQYEVGKEHVTDDAKLCSTGFHACEDPLDCFQYYSPGQSVYHSVELDATDEKHPDDSKRVGKRIKIGAELSVAQICRLHFGYVKEHCINENNAKHGKPATVGSYGAATAGSSSAATAGSHGAATVGDDGAATAGYHGVAMSGECGAATAGSRGAAMSGSHGAATAGSHGAAMSGNDGAATAGYHGVATAGSYGAATAGDGGAATVGSYGAATAGDGGAATAGYGGAATSRGSATVGENGIACARGNGCMVRGGMGAILVVAEEAEDDYDIAAWKAVVVDGENIKADTWYRLVNGKFAEVQD